VNVNLIFQQPGEILVFIEVKIGGGGVI